MDNIAITGITPGCLFLQLKNNRGNQISSGGNLSQRGLPGLGVIDGFFTKKRNMTFYATIAVTAVIRNRP